MKKNVIISAVAGAVALGGVALPSFAHHSTAMFTWGESKPLNDMTVERWEWTNPHTFLYVRDANGQRWAFEGMSPNHLVRYGWSRRSVQPGDKINLTYYPLRDGRRGGFNVTVTKAGKTLNQFGEGGSVQDQARSARN
jgi:hypothetical protein